MRYLWIGGLEDRRLSGKLALNLPVSQSPNRKLRNCSAGLLDHCNRLFLRLYHLACDDALADLFLARERVHQVEHDFLDGHAEPARADLATERGFRDRLEGVV